MNAPQSCLLSDRAFIVVSGSDAAGWLQGLVTNDMDLLTEEQSLYAALLTPQGKVMFDFFLLRRGEEILIDSRPSDAIAIALRTESPVFVEESVLEAASGFELSNDPEQKEKLKKWLENLDMGSLGKYKM